MRQPRAVGRVPEHGGRLREQIGGSEQVRAGDQVWIGLRLRRIVRRCAGVDPVSELEAPLPQVAIASRWSTPALADGHCSWSTPMLPKRWYNSQGRIVAKSPQGSRRGLPMNDPHHLSIEYREILTVSRCDDNH
jgi:hypothetical protein